jgi:hypothetical protein
LSAIEISLAVAVRAEPFGAARQEYFTQTGNSFPRVSDRPKITVVYKIALTRPG